MIDLRILFIVILSTLLIIYLLLREDHRHASRNLFVLFCTLFLIWSVTHTITTYIDAAKFLFWVRIDMLAATIKTLALSMFAIHYPKRTFSFSRLSVALIFLGFVAAGISISPWLFSEVTEVNNSPQPIPGPGMIIYMPIIFILLTAGIVSLVRKFKSAKDLARIQLRYILIGISTSIIFLVITNFFLVVIFSNTYFIPYSLLFVLPFVFFTFYAIMAHRLLDTIIAVRKNAMTFAALIVTFYALVSLVGRFKYALMELLNISMDDLFLYAAFTVAVITMPIFWVLSKIIDRFVFNEEVDIFKRVNNNHYLQTKPVSLRSFSEEVIKHMNSFFGADYCEILVWEEDEKKYVQYYKPKKEIYLNASDPLVRILERAQRQIFVEDFEKYALQEGIEKDLIKSCLRRLKQLDIKILLPIIVHDRILALCMVGNGKNIEKTDIELTGFSLELARKLSFTLLVNYQFKPLEQ